MHGAPRPKAPGDGARRGRARPAMEILLTRKAYAEECVWSRAMT